MGRDRVLRVIDAKKLKVKVWFKSKLTKRVVSVYTKKRVA